MQNSKRVKNRILYSQNQYENFDLDKEYTDSIKMKKSELLLTMIKLINLKNKKGEECSQTLLLIVFYNTKISL